MSKHKPNSFGKPNDQRANTKNPNNSAYRADRANRIRQAHPAPSAAPPRPTQDKK